MYNRVSLGWTCSVLTDCLTCFPGVVYAECALGSDATGQGVLTRALRLPWTAGPFKGILEVSCDGGMPYAVAEDSVRGEFDC